MRYGEVMVVVHLYWPASPTVSELKEMVAVWRMAFSGVGVTLSQRKLSEVTPSDSSPTTSHVSEYVCPSIGVPVGVMTSVSSGTTHC